MCKKAFSDLASGDFELGLLELNQSADWADNTRHSTVLFTSDFRAQGWGEGLLTASLLKRYAADAQKRIKVFARREVWSVLKRDCAFCVQTVTSYAEARSSGARSPLAILVHALTGRLLELPFVMIDAGADCLQSRQSNPRIGIAWASVSNGKPIREKSIPLERCLSILDDVDAAVISFQRELEEPDLGRFERCTAIISDSKLNATDQADLVSEIRGLDCMVTISTTTAHIAACLGIPVVLLAARREKQQWFWRAQAEHNKCFYPHLDVILGSEPNKSGDWWTSCLGPAKHALLGKLDRRPRRAT